ncbi:MAG: glycosyltransferase family 4 protein [Actinomycetota bacterium]
MRIALIAPPWLPVPPPGYGGTELVIDLLARGLVAAGHDVTLATVGTSTCPVRRRHRYDVPQWTAAGDTTVLRELAHVTWAYGDLGAVDVVHDHTLVGPFVGALAGHRVVTTNHGPFRSSDVRQVFCSYPPEVSVVAISHDQASAHDGPIAAVIHHGVDVESYRADARRGDYLLFLGRMHPDKGTHLAIEVARRSGRPLRIAAKLRERQEHAYYDDVVRPLLDEDVQYVGEADRCAKRELLAGAAALVNPIRWPEPFGLVMAEALASGTPVITTPMGAAPEIVDDGVTGFLCDDVDEMVAAVAAVDGLDRRACRRAAEQRFSIERMTRDHVRLYRRILATSGNGGQGPSLTTRRRAHGYHRPGGQVA